MASDGRTRMGACGHLERAVVSQFYLCTVNGCTGSQHCKCGSDKVEAFEAAGLPPGSVHCWACGRVWRPGISASQ